MAKVIIFGLQDFASLAHFYLKQEKKHEIVSFTANEDYLKGTSFFEGVPITPFEEVEKKFSPTSHKFFAPMSYRKMNRLRAQIYSKIKAKGYEMITYINPTSEVASGTKIGENCFILEKNIIQPFVTIGENVMVWSGNQISHHSVIMDHVFFGSRVAMSGHCIVEPYSFLGINSTIRENTLIHEGTLVAMGALITADTESWCIYKGIPAKKSPGSSRDFVV